jgi:hypothetical protein
LGRREGPESLLYYGYEKLLQRPEPKCQNPRSLSDRGPVGVSVPSLPVPIAA